MTSSASTRPSTLILTIGAVILLLTAGATVMESLYGHAAAAAVCRGPAAMALWVAEALLCIWHFVRQAASTGMTVKLMHAALLLVFAGAMLTHFTSVSGHLTLGRNETTACFADRNGYRTDLPFSLKLETSEVLHYPGTDDVMQYAATLRTAPDGHLMHLAVNHIGRKKGYRFYLMDCTPDNIRLDVIRDPAGTSCTYAGFVLFLTTFTCWLLRRRKTAVATGQGQDARPARFSHTIRKAGIALLMLAAVCLSALFIIRWHLTGYVPLATGGDAMCFMALCLCLTALAVRRRFATAVPGGLLLTAFVLLAACIDHSAGLRHVAPVLRSPLLLLHVAVIMFAYTLIAFIFFNAATGLLCQAVHRDEAVRSLIPASERMLGPAVLFLSAGIMLGALWSNISWGGYWSWDPKENWAFITLAVYALPLHPRMAAALSARRPAGYHLYMVLAFCALLMTWFGVRLLGGLHSYA